MTSSTVVLKERDSWKLSTLSQSCDTNINTHTSHTHTQRASLMLLKAAQCCEHQPGFLYPAGAACLSAALRFTGGNKGSAVVPSSVANEFLSR